MDNLTSNGSSVETQEYDTDWFHISMRAIFLLGVLALLIIPLAPINPKSLSGFGLEISCFLHDCSIIFLGL